MDSGSYSLVNNKVSLVSSKSRQNELERNVIAFSKIEGEDGSHFNDGGYRYNICIVTNKKYYVIGGNKMVPFQPNRETRQDNKIRGISTRPPLEIAPSKCYKIAQGRTDTTINSLRFSKGLQRSHIEGGTLRAIDLGNEIELALLAKCRRICAKITEDSEEPTEKNLRMFEVVGIRHYFRNEDLPDLALQSKEDSKKVQAHIYSLSGEQLGSAVSIFRGRIGEFIGHEIGYYLLKGLIQLSERFRDDCEAYSLQHFESLITSRYAVRVIKCFLSSESFCSKAIQIFRRSFDCLITNIHSVLILSSLIAKSPNEASIEFVIEKLAEQKLNEKDCLWLRVLSSLIDRVSGRNLSRISSIVGPQMRWLIDHRLGIFGIQSLIRKKDTATIKRVEQLIGENPVNFFVRKNRRFVFIEMLKSTNNGRSSVMEHVLNELLGDYHSMRCIVKREDTTWIMNALIWKVCTHNLHLLYKVIGKVKRMLDETVRSFGQRENMESLLDFSVRIDEGNYSKILEIARN